MGGIVDTVVKVGSFGLIDTDFSGEQAGKDAANASIHAANISANAQKAALDYLKETEALPQQFREEALQHLGAAYGLPGEVSGSELNKAVMGSPLYKHMLGDVKDQEEAILRNQSATGALRGGATDMMLAENMRKNKANAFVNTLQGIQGLARIPSNANTIASAMSGIGRTQGQGVVAAEQARQLAQQQGMNNLMGLGQLGLSAFAAFCDPRLKANAVKICVIDGVQIYEWDWNDKAEKLGLTGRGVGPMADEIARIWPDRIREKLGYMYVEAA